MTPFPTDLPLTLDHSVWTGQRGRLLIGGDPRRALQLSPTGAGVLRGLLSTGSGPSPNARRLARTLVDGGLAHPRPPAAAAAGVTVVVPVRDRTAAVERCLEALASETVPVLVVDDGSRDPHAVAMVCARHNVRLVHRRTPGGPGAARNTALEHVSTPLVAFLDSDCVPRSGWLDVLAGHFADPLVAAVAPRVHGLPGSGSHVGRFAAAHSPLDLGPWPARVVPGGRVAYVPAAALVLRRAALADGFDAALRYGEDVDLVWRLHDAGWHVRYDPAAAVDHAEPEELRTLLARRFHYGTSAAPLAKRHPKRLAPFVVQPWSTAVTALILAGRPKLAVTVTVVHGLAAARRLGPMGLPASAALTYSARGAVKTLVAAGRAAAMLAPTGLAAGIAHRHTRRAALTLLLVPPLSAWGTARPRLDPVRWSVLSIADDAAYGAGVWAGVLHARTPAPLIPARMRSSANSARRQS